MTKFAERKKKWGSEMVFQSISLPVNIIEKLKLLKEQYADCYGRKVSYGEIFERMFSPMALGNVDPGVYARFDEALKSRGEFDEVVTRATNKAVEDLAKRTEENGTSLAEEAEKERKAVVEKMDQERLAAGLGLTAEQLKENEATFDPTAPENEPWKLRYLFEKDGEQVDALPGDLVPFYAKVNGFNIGMSKLLADGWTLQNEVGVELDLEQAQKIRALIREHQN